MHRLNQKYYYRTVYKCGARISKSIDIYNYLIYQKIYKIRIVAYNNIIYLKSADENYVKYRILDEKWAVARVSDYFFFL